MAVYDPEKEKTTEPKHDGSHDDLGVHPEHREAEVADLEKQFGEPSADKKDEVGQDEADDLDSGGWKTDVDDEGAPKKKNKRKARVTTGAVTGGAGVLLAGGLFGFFTFFAGPLQMIHLGEVLDKFSLQSNKTISKRIGSFTKYTNLRSARTGSIGETRVSFLGSKRFAKVDAQLKDVGVSLNESINGQLTSVVVEPAKHPNLNNFADDLDGARNAIARLYDVDPTDVKQVSGLSGGKFYIDAGTKIGFQRSLVGTSISALSTGEIGSAMNMRQIGKWYDLPSLFHPIQRASARIDSEIAVRSRAKAVERERARKQKTQGPIQEKYDAAKNSLNEKLTPNVKSSLTGAVMVAGALCTLRDISDGISQFNNEVIVAPSQTESTEKRALGSQLKSGDDVDLEQYGDINKTFIDEDGKSIWDSKALNGLANGTAGEGEEINDGYKQAFLPGSFNATVDSIVNNQGTAFTCSAPGQIIQAVVGVTLLVTSGGSSSIASNIAKEGLKSAVMVAVMGLVQDIANGVFGQDAIEQYAGAQGGSLLAYGARSAQNVSSMAMGGIPLPGTDARIASAQYEQEELKEFQSQSFATRLFDVEDHRSLAGSLALSISPSVSDGTQSIASSLSPGKLLNSLSTIFTPRAFAQEAEYDWGFPVVSIPPEVLDNPLYEDPYVNSDEAVALFNSSGGQAYRDKAKTCFGATIANNASWDVTTDEVVNPNERSYEEANCGDTSDPNWIRTMLYVLDSGIVTQVDCWEGGEESCQEIGFGGGSQANTSNPTAGATIVGDVFQSSVDVQCAAGTTDVGIHEGYNDGNAVPVRLCAIPNLPSQASESNPGSSYYIQGADGHAVVNSRVSGAVQALVAAAAADGVQLTASSAFRSNAHQAALFAANPNPNLVAPAGQSNHQMGIAIDFAGTNVKNSSARTCASRQTDPGSPVWTWLSNNALKFGFRQYSAESWHWDASTGASRCE